MKFDGATAPGAGHNDASDVLQERGEQLIVQYGENCYELPSHCPHKGAPLISGYLVGPFLRCPWHGATFDIRNGARLRGPACADLKVRKTAAECPAGRIPTVPADT